MATGLQDARILAADLVEGVARHLGESRLTETKPPRTSVTAMASPLSAKTCAEAGVAPGALLQHQMANVGRDRLQHLDVIFCPVPDDVPIWKTDEAPQAALDADRQHDHRREFVRDQPVAIGGHLAVEDDATGGFVLQESPPGRYGNAPGEPGIVVIGAVCPPVVMNDQACRRLAGRQGLFDHRAAIGPDRRPDPSQRLGIGCSAEFAVSNRLPASATDLSRPARRSVAASASLRSVRSASPTTRPAPSICRSKMSGHRDQHGDRAPSAVNQSASPPSLKIPRAVRSIRSLPGCRHGAAAH